MDNSNSVLLSICIPTCKRPEIIRTLLNSIIMQNVDHRLYEICITDNSETDETCVVISEEFYDIDNLHYKKVDCKGFYNSIEALKFGCGRLLKLHNDYSIFKPGALQRMIDRIRTEEHDHAQLFFTSGNLKKKFYKEEYKDYNSFMACISYQATWSSAFAIWRNDFEIISNSGINPDTMFPHTSYLHKVINKERYVVDNYPYIHNVEPKKKGGYNLIDNFVRIYLTMVEIDLLNNKIITQKTYRRIEKDILRFCAEWYYITTENPQKYTFGFDDAEKIINDRCGKDGVKKYRLFLIRRKIGRIRLEIKNMIIRMIS